MADENGAPGSSRSSRNVELQVVPTLNSTHQQMKKCVTVDLLTASQREVNFLRMIDRKAPVLYEKSVVENAIRRYETYWLPMQSAKPDLNNIPPLDIHWIWHTHMLCPVAYEEDCVRICGQIVDHKLLSSDEIQQRYEQSVSLWNEFCPDEPYDFLNSNVSVAQDYVQKSKYNIADAVQRQRNFNYQVSLPHFTSPKFLKDAIDRYINFLLIKQTYPEQFFTPCYDFDLVWHTHQVHAAAYRRDCTAIFGSILRHDDSVNDRSKNSKLLKGEAATKKAWAAHFKEGFWRRGCMYRGHVAPVFLGFESQDMGIITYGHVHIPSISLKEIPVQREQLRLKLSYGGKKITTFNADLADKQVTRSSFSLVWQPSDSGGFSTSSIVKFPFEKKNAKDLVVELELYDKVFLQKRDIVTLTGRLPLEQLIPGSNLKTVQNHMPLESVNAERVMNAKVTVITSISLNREMELMAGDYVEQPIEPDSRLWTLCQSAALNRTALQPNAKAYVATHNLIDTRDGAKYFVQVVHNADMLLSMVLVYGAGQRLLCMAHLIGADSLPSKEQLDSNLQFLPHLSSPDERVFIVLNKDGDSAIVKGRWNGFSRKISGDKMHKGKPGSAGVLNVELFNLLKNTVQKIQLPGADGSTLFVLGDAQARLNGRRIHCRSTQTAEHIACIFSIGTLFVLCNPDKVRSRQDTTMVGHQCQKWPIPIACGYGKPVPSNRYLVGRQEGAACDATPALLAMFGSAGLCDSGAGCGSACAGCSACGACGGCGGEFLDYVHVQLRSRKKDMDVFVPTPV
uniref:AAA domain-containing protein n=1 Tax=Bursaphelenchus xylophilus TaxID=6326 RepID=A0A1I7SDS2_BURXY